MKPASKSSGLSPNLFILAQNKRIFRFIPPDFAVDPSQGASLVTVLSWLSVLLAVCLPFIVFAALVHLLERIGQRLLAQRFGWKSVMWTGWLGTPVHELSHVVMCLLFRHRIDEVALFEPDRKSGRLGYVRHSYRSKSWFEELGNPFIAVAPLIGGSIVLLFLVWLFYGNDIAPVAIESDSLGPVMESNLFSSVGDVLGNVFRPEHIITLKFWMFVYLVLCVGSHMAPSRSDYQGAGKGVAIIVLAVAVVVSALSVLMQPPADLTIRIITILSPLFAMFITITILLAFTTLVIAMLVQFFPQRYVAR